MFFSNKKVSCEVLNFRRGFVSLSSMSDKAYSLMIEPFESVIVSLGLMDTIVSVVRKVTETESFSQYGKKISCVFASYLVIAGGRSADKSTSHVSHFELDRAYWFVKMLSHTPEGQKWLEESELLSDSWRYLRGGKSLFSFIEGIENSNSPDNVSSSKQNESYSVDDEDEADDVITKHEQNAIHDLLQPGEAKLKDSGSKKSDSEHEHVHVQENELVDSGDETLSQLLSESNDIDPMQLLDDSEKVSSKNCEVEPVKQENSDNLGKNSEEPEEPQITLDNITSLLK